MKFLLYSIIFFCFSITAFSQNLLKGKVYDANTKAPLSGAVISTSGKNKATTAADGSFSIQCNAPSEITVSFIGFAVHKVAVKNCNDELKIALAPFNNTLEDVEITATWVRINQYYFNPNQ